uniref:sucrase-isomaltase, intestinal-like n=1 Tax=Myxine glutinosa TaxID=7769 RepID=UPI00358F0BC8
MLKVRKLSSLEVNLILLFLFMTAIVVALLAVIGTTELGRVHDDTVPPVPPGPTGPPVKCGDREPERFDCYPHHDVNQENCEKRGCCWMPSQNPNVPWCFFQKTGGYKAEDRKNTTHGFQYKLSYLGTPVLFEDNIESLRFIVEYETATRLHFKIIDPNSKRFEVPLQKPAAESIGNAAENLYLLEVKDNPFGIQVIRKSSQRILIDTTVAPLMFTEQFLHLAFKLASFNMYGLGEHIHRQFRHDFTKWITWPMFTRDTAPNGVVSNLYGHHPFVTCLEDTNGNAFGVFFLNLNAMEATVQPLPAITFRSTGGILDFYLFMGPTPEDVVSQYLEVVGRPLMPPYWGLGFQLSRWGYADLEDTKATVKRNREAGIPYDIQCVDIEYMEDHKDFTIDSVKWGQLPEFVQDLHANDQYYILILDPAISINKRRNGTPYQTYEKGTTIGVWVNTSDGQPLVGEVWPGDAVFPDFTNPSCVSWWSNECEDFYKKVQYDGFWIDMNEPSSFIPGSKQGCVDNRWNNPPFIPDIMDGEMYMKTLCMDALQTWGRHYDVHSLYGYSMAIATQSAGRKVFPNKRTMVISRSTAPGSGAYTGHWLGDNAATWNDLRWSIIGMLEFNLFGIPFIGADICGFSDNTTEELCRRWMQVGAFYPFSRNHNAEGFKPQDPASFGPNSLLLNASSAALHIRYTLLPYLYTLFHWAHVHGSTVVRPIMHEFPKDQNTWALDQQFLWGPALMIVPVLREGAEWAIAYFPDAPWYEYELGTKTIHRSHNFNVSVPADKIGLYVRGGYILPTQKATNRTASSRKQPMTLLIALDDDGSAVGDLFWDDGESSETYESKNYIYSTFTCKENKLSVVSEFNNYKDPEPVVIDVLRILGYDSALLIVVVQNDKNDSTILEANNIKYDPINKVNTVQGMKMVVGSSYSVFWDSVVRFDCHPEPKASRQLCEDRGCIWKETTIPNAPYCIFPLDYGYKISKSIKNGETQKIAEITRNTDYPSRYKSASPDIGTLEIKVDLLTDYLVRFKVSDPNNARYEVPVPLNVPEPSHLNQQLYTVDLVDGPFGLKITRKTNKAVIWNSQVPGLTFTEKFIQISSFLPSEYIYGLGETMHDSFLLKFNWESWALFSKDQPPQTLSNSYGVHPFYMAVEDEENAHGVLLFNSNAMDVTLQSNLAITYHTVGGLLDFFIFLGPSPEDVVQQYTELIGRPMLPPYWALGFQLCRYGYKNDSEIKELYNAMKLANMPYDIQYADIDYMERQLDFTLDSKDFSHLPELIDAMHSEDMHFILILDPAISVNETENYLPFTRGLKNDVFIKTNDGSQIMFGKVWPDYPNITVNESLDWEDQVKRYRAYVAFPDFLKQRTHEWWSREISDLYKKLKFDGLWIDMNEPSSFVSGSTVGCSRDDLNKPPYMPVVSDRDMGLQFKTLCMEALQERADGNLTLHYDVHSLYGWAQTRPTLQALRNVTRKRSVVITRSTFPSSGQWAGHWLGDNTANWISLKHSIIGMMEFSLFGISYTGSDICGFFSDSEYELCLRWMQLGSFYPFSRNHNTINTKRQDPVAWNDTFTNISRQVLQVRYSLLPYLYTIMFEASSIGSTVVRPLLHEFLNDRETWSIDEQFLWGPALLITPVLKKGDTTVRGYFPDALWYDFYTGALLGKRKEKALLPAPLDVIPLHIRGGYIIPWQEPNTTTVSSRNNPLGLFVALDETGQSSGSLFWDDGDSIDTYKNDVYTQLTFSVKKQTLTSNLLKDHVESTADSLKFGKISILGVGTQLVSNVTYSSGNSTETILLKNLYDSDISTEVLTIFLESLDLKVLDILKVTWKMDDS